MSTYERRENVLEELKKSRKPLSASFLADKFGVSRQIIVGDIALLRAEDNEIISTNRGYILKREDGYTKKITVKHSKEQMREELNTIVDYGGKVLDVIVNHPKYGEIKVDLAISNRLDVENFMSDMGSNNIPLSALTNDEHIHTIEAESSENLDYIVGKLREAGILK